MTGRFRMTFGGFGQYEVDGQSYVTDRDRPQGNFESVSDNYFTTIGLKILQGRDFTIDDSDANQPMAPPDYERTILRPGTGGLY